ncbi:twin-arginine translocation signal domain-containing protein [Streptomyces sp. NPDC008240]
MPFRESRRDFLGALSAGASGCGSGRGAHAVCRPGSRPSSR